MQPPYVTSYIASFGECVASNLLNPRFFIVAATTISLFSLLWFSFQRFTRNKKMTHALNTAAFNGLHQAAFENDVLATFRIIQRYPAAINMPHPIDGYTPFMRACLNGNTQLVRVMLSCGADVAHKSTKGETPFYLAVFYHIQHPRIKDASCIHTLYYAGSDINAANNKGFTPLHLAAMFGHTHLARWLLNKGASVAIQPDPFVLARLQGHYETAGLLEQRRLPAIE